MRKTYRLALYLLLQLFNLLCSSSNRTDKHLFMLDESIQLLQSHVALRLPLTLLHLKGVLFFVHLCLQGVNHPLQLLQAALPVPQLDVRLDVHLTPLIVQIGFFVELIFFDLVQLVILHPQLVQPCLCNHPLMLRLSLQPVVLVDHLNFVSLGLHFLFVCFDSCLAVIFEGGFLLPQVWDNFAQLGFLNLDHVGLD